MPPLKNITLIGRTNGRHPQRLFGIRHHDRLNHLYLIGRTGVGKSNLVEGLALQDIYNGHGLCVMDPHGDLVNRLEQAIPESRRHDLIYFDPANRHQPYTYNPLRAVPKHLVPLAASGLLEAFKKLWVRDWGTRMEHILRNCLFALLETGESTLPDILTLLSDTGFRREVVQQITNDQVRRFWQQEFPKYNPRYKQEMIAPIQNKVGAFLADPRLRRAVTAGNNDIRIRRVMDKQQILLVNLSKGLFGDDSASLLGALLVSAISLAGLSRENLAPNKRTPFYTYIDEFQSVTTESVANVVSELRKFGIGLTVANQHLEQLDPAVRHAILGNVGTLISFRIGPEDATMIAREFSPTFSASDLVSLPNYAMYLKLMIDGAPSRPFSANTLSVQELFPN